ncbi:MAG TPA: DUF1501 domain-containing protein [Gemmataceae bacterium]|jgi:hypothetical protein|nr:DUF1501 domain-containing protein [Gemmataceae bacterium]
MPHSDRSSACRDFRQTRRRFLGSSVGLFGLSLASLLQIRERASASTRHGSAKSCIVFFSWGGLSQLESFDPKPDAPIEVRGDYRPIATSVPGIRFGEYLPMLAAQAHRLAVVRSVRHPESGHRNAAYWNLTGHPPLTPGNDTAILPSRHDWPCLGSMVSKFRPSRGGLPGNIVLPYQIADRGLVNGQTGGFLGINHDPMILHPGRGQAYAGVSPTGATADLRLPGGVAAERMHDRVELRNSIESAHETIPAPGLEHYRDMATDLMLRPAVSSAFDLDRESLRLRSRYGDHVCGQSALLARRLTEAGVPIVTVYSSVGDLNGSVGANFDTHGNNFPRLRNELLPPLEMASRALLDDLADRGRLEDTLVVWLTEFGRTPRLNGGAGRDHFPFCYSVALAGGGIRGGQVHGRSDATASTPADLPCSPADLHATIFRALGIPADATLEDAFGRPMPLCAGTALPLFG